MNFKMFFFPPVNEAFGILIEIALYLGHLGSCGRFNHLRTQDVFSFVCVSRSLQNVLFVYKSITSRNKFIPWCFTLSDTTVMRLFS